MDRKDVLVQVMCLLAGMLCADCQEFPELQLALSDALEQLAAEDEPNET